MHPRTRRTPASDSQKAGPATPGRLEAAEQDKPKRSTKPVYVFGAAVLFIVLAGSLLFSSLTETIGREHEESRRLQGGTATTTRPTTRTTIRTTTRTTTRTSTRTTRATTTTTTSTAPRFGAWSLLKRANVAAAHALLVPGTNRVLLIERPTNPHPDKNSDEMVAVYDLDFAEPNSAGNHYTPVYNVYDSIFCGGHMVTPQGNLVVLGGNPPINKCISGQGCDTAADGLSMVRVFRRTDPTKVDYAQTLARPRWYPSTITLPDGSALTMGGTTTVDGMDGFDINNNFETWRHNPSGRQQSPRLFTISRKFAEDSRGFWYPFVTLLPSGDVFVFGDRYGIIVDPNNNAAQRSTTPALPNYNRFSDAARLYPFHAPARMLPIRLPNAMQPGADLPVDSVELIWWGGQTAFAPADRPALDTAIRLRVTMARDTVDRNRWVYRYGSWEVETMPGPRFQHCVVNLPNGKWIHVNGAQRGFQGDSGMANLPSTAAWEYDPSKPSGQRYRVVAATRIMRMYHNTACLLTDGRVGVWGSDRNNAKSIGHTSADIDPSPWGEAEFRVEAFAPPDWSLTKPAISNWSANNTLTVQYSQQFTVQYTYSGAAAFRQITLHAPCSSTHGTDQNQRTLILPVKSQALANGAGQVAVLAPPNGRYAPPGFYLLFVVMGDGAYSNAKWLQVLG